MRRLATASLALALLATSAASQFGNIDLVAGTYGYGFYNQQTPLAVQGGTAHANEFFLIYPTLNVTPSTFTIGSSTVTVPTTPDQLYLAFQTAGFNLNCGAMPPVTPSWCLTGQLDGSGFGSGTINLPPSFPGTIFLTAVVFDASLNITGVSYPSLMSVTGYVPPPWYHGPADVIIPQGGYPFDPSAGLPYPTPSGCNAPTQPTANFYTCTPNGFAGTVNIPPVAGVSNVQFGCAVGTGNAYHIDLRSLKTVCQTALGQGLTWLDLQLCWGPGQQLDEAFIVPSAVPQALNFNFWVLDKIDCESAVLPGCVNGFNPGCIPTWPFPTITSTSKALCLDDVSCLDDCFIDQGLIIRIDCCRLEALITHVDASYQPPLTAPPLTIDVAVAFCAP